MISFNQPLIVFIVLGDYLLSAIFVFTANIRAVQVLSENITSVKIFYEDMCYANQCYHLEFTGC